MASHRLDDDGIRAEIARMHGQTGYILDPHTACGTAAARSAGLDPAIPVITHGQAHPAKFPDAVASALGKKPAVPAALAAIMEKPEHPRSSFAVTGIYFLDGTAPELAKQIKPSARGELEITDLLNFYREAGKLNVERLGRGYAWLDTGTHDSLLEAADFVRTIEKRQNLKISCPEEISFLNGWITKTQLLQLAQPYQKTQYGQYLVRISEGS